MILLSYKDGKVWPRHLSGDWFTAEERYAWATEKLIEIEKVAADVFNRLMPEQRP